MRIRATITTLALLATAACGHTENPVTDASPANTTVSTTKSIPDTTTATWGKRYTWSDGLAVEVAPPTACSPSKSAVAAAGTRAVLFTITVINGTPNPVNASLFGMGADVQVDGRRVESITDLSGPCGPGFGSGTVLPGKTFAFTMAYPVGAVPGEVQMVFKPRAGSPQAVFVGQA